MSSASTTKRVWPIVVTQSDHLVGAHVDIESTVSLFEDGRVNIVTHTHDNSKLKAGHAAVVAVFYDAADNCVYTTASYRYDVQGSWLGQTDRTDTATTNIDPDVLNATKKLAIKHFASPNSVADDVSVWLAEAQRDFQFAAAIAQSVDVVARTAQTLRQ